MTKPRSPIEQEDFFEQKLNDSYERYPKTRNMNDESIMPIGKYKGEKMANVPSEYLLWLYENGNIYGELKAYIKDNLDVLKSEINFKQKSK